MRNRLGCLTGSGMLAALITMTVIFGITLAQGGILFSPGELNARQGELKGGVTSHAELENQCKACHAPFWSLKRMAERCLTCHLEISIEQVDLHSLHGVIAATGGKLACRDCHTDHNGPDGYLTSMDPKQFPHEALGYAMSGHQTLPDGAPFQCRDCHTGESYSPFDPFTCKVCHEQIDPPFTAAHSQAFGDDCLACHDGVDRYGRDFDHNQLAFPLAGKHAEVTCGQCHLVARSVVELQSTPVECASCHLEDDPHQGRFGVGCVSCHTPAGWSPALFDHNLAAFKLEGLHVDVPCQDCHKDGIYQGTPADCFSCHGVDDPHGGRFGSDCAACHTSNGWTPALFNHDLAAFKLVGKHLITACEDCHKQGVYQATPADCFSCHALDDPHAGQFGPACEACHTSLGWLPATFDHSRSKFPLTGDHVNTACSRCHVNAIYRGTPTACVACHADPAIHAGLFGSVCSQCHNTSAWIPASFTLPHTFPINHEGANTCRNCHPASLASWTCYTCHNQAEMQDKHKEVGDFSNCMRCHPTGRKEEGGGD